MTKPFLAYTLGLLLLVISSLSIFFGEVPWTMVWQGALDRLYGLSNAWNPLIDERLPRFIVLLSTGASLAVSGAVMQALFHNPLASPSILGISCGGCLCIVIVFILGWNIHYPYAIPIAAFGGSLGTLLLIYLLSSYFRGTSSLNSLLLMGIALSTLLLSVQSALLYAMRDQWQLIQTLTEWEAGSTLDRNWKHVHMQFPLACIGLLVCWRYRREIDILSLGEEESLNLGVDVSTVRWRLFLCVAILTAGSLAAVGSIAFFGLILPHILRYFNGPSNLHLIPLCIIVGASSLVGLDFLLRLLQIQAFSIGNISAILGALFFILLLMGRQSVTENLN